MFRLDSCMVLFSVLVFVSGCGGAPKTKTISSNKTYRAQTTKDVPVCRYEPVTGSHMIRKRCYTQQELAQMSEQSKAWLRTGGRSGGPTVVRDSADPRDNDED